MNRHETIWLRHIRTRGDGVKNCRILVACSGGGDSTALLVFLWALRKVLGLDLMVAHADHGLRSESIEDAAFVAKLCRDLDLDLVEAKLDVAGHAKKMGMGLETAARELRWEWLRSEAESCGATVVATGHTLDDHTETVCIRLSRGGGSGALLPLPARQQLRWSPFIQVRRQELRDYLKQCGLPWREDASNEDGFTGRNRWRKLLAQIRQEAPTLDQHLWETHQQVRELKDFLESTLESWRGQRWQVLENPCRVRLSGPWTELELRWVLEAAFRELSWHREAELLRGLAAWAHPHLNRKSRKTKCWGGWLLEAEGFHWMLQRQSDLTKPRRDEDSMPNPSRRH